MCMFLQIHNGLHELLGKPVLVGVDNLTWTLVKFIEPGCDDVGRIRHDNSVAENYSKLNLALAVMHECFESLKQSLSSRDIIEDVIFGRRSNIAIYPLRYHHNIFSCSLYFCYLLDLLLFFVSKFCYIVVLSLALYLIYLYFGTL